MAVRVRVAPQVLNWALDRTSDADSVLTAFPKFSAWLTGDLEPTLRQLQAFAARTGVPFGYMLLDRPPGLKLPVPDFREGFHGDLGNPSPDLLAVVHLSLRRQDWYREYAENLALPIVESVGSCASATVDRAAGEMRNTLTFEVDQRRGDWGAVRRHLLSAFENIGGLTTATSMVENNTHRLLDPNEFRGFSLVDPLAPLVFVNTRQTLNGQIFTLAHEFAHIWRGQGGISLEDLLWEPQNATEKWCNDVASEFLVPSSDLRGRYQAVRLEPLTRQLELLGSIYRCGTLVVLQAIRRTGLAIFDDFDAVYRMELERLRALSELREGRDGGTFWSNQPYRIGGRLSRAIVSDALQGRTSISEALRLTALKSVSNFDTYATQLGVG